MVVILRQGSSNHNLMVESSLSLVFINTVLLELGHAYSFTYAYACFPAIAGVGNGSESLEYLLSSLLQFADPCPWNRGELDYYLFRNPFIFGNE